VLSSASEKKRRCFGVPPLADPPLLDQLVRAVFPWCQAKMRPAFARAREPSRIVDGDLKAIDARAPAPEAVIRRRQTGSTRTQRPCALLLPTRNGVLRNRAALDRQILRIRDRGADRRHGAENVAGRLSAMNSTRSLLITYPQGLRRFPPAAVASAAREPGFGRALSVSGPCQAYGPAAETRDYGVDRLILALPCPSRRPIS
jgi:hypothetical protein